MTQRVSDSELADRIRRQNRVHSRTRRERLADAGQVPFMTWIPAALQRAVASLAAARGERLSETTAALLIAGLNATPATPKAKPAAVVVELVPDMFLSTPTIPTDKDVLMTWVGGLLKEGHTGNAIARQLNASGQRTASGALFTGQNLLRDYRAWVKNTSADSKPKPD